MNHPAAVLLAPSPAGEQKVYDLMYYLKGAAAGGICCSITHGALTPVDVVKTRVQLDPVKVSISPTLWALEVLLRRFQRSRGVSSLIKKTNIA
jgi:hypothetical protein